MNISPHPNRALYISSLFILLSLGLTSCIRLAVNGVKKQTKLEYVVPTAAMYADTTFQGLGTFIDDAADSANILMVHGLTRKTPSHFDFMVQRLAYKLDLRLVRAKHDVTLVQRSANDPANRVLGLGACKFYEWNFLRRSDQKPVNFYFVYWAPVFETAKQFIHAYDHTPYRTRLATHVKDSLFIDVVSDLALSLNTRCQVQMHSLFLQSIEKIKGDICVVGGGFGVQMMFDAMQVALGRRLQRGESDTTAAAKRNRAVQVGAYTKVIREEVAVDRQAVPLKFNNPYNITKVFLIGNQFPFVSLLTLKPQDSVRVDSLNNQVYYMFNNFLALKKKIDTNAKLELISFYDPNDPFGYKLPKPSSKSSLVVKNVKLNVAEYWQIDPRRTTDFVVPKLKNEKAAEFFLSVIDQQDETQSLLLNLEGPSNQSRNDYRIIGALAQGSSYRFICLSAERRAVRPRELYPHAKKLTSGLEARIGEDIITRVTQRIDPKRSVLPFSLPSKFRDMQSHNYYSRTFDGMDTSIAKHNVTQLLTVHGVRNQEPDHFDMMTKEIAKSLGFYETPVAFRVECAENEKCPGANGSSYGPGTVKISTFKNVTGKFLIIYNVYWSSVTLPTKQWLDSISVYPESSVVPKFVKKSLITDGFGDIELTFREYRPKIDATLATAFREMEGDLEKYNGTPTDLNTYYMTGSLGTRLLMNYLNTNISKGNTKSVQSRTKTWFMLTNQLIITSLISMPMRQGRVEYDQYFRETYSRGIRDLLNDPNSPFEIVAFNDPNDFMSFVIPDDVMGIGQPGRVHNNFVNLAQGQEMNMNALIKIAWRVDKNLQRYHRKKYTKEIDDFSKLKKTLCGVDLNPGTLDKNDDYWEMEDIMKMAKKRFKFRHHLHQSRSNKTNDKINQQLLAGNDDLNKSKLERKINRKKRWYTTDLYVAKEIFTNAKTEYKQVKREAKLSAKRGNVRGKPVISRCAFNKLYKPGLIMPFLRDISNYMMYQDFVSDFGRAHIGSRTNKKIISMMSHGFESVTKTDTDQKLYRHVHNPNEN